MSATMMKPTFTGRVTMSRSKVVRTVCAAARPLWLPGTTVPAHLDGTLAGDFGYDPLGLGKDPASLKWYVQAELIHARTAMAAVAGILVPSILTHAHLMNVPDFFIAGQVSNEAPGAIPFNALIVVQLFLTGFIEVKRWVDFNKPQSQGEKGSFLGFEAAFTGSGNNAYPGGLFDPLGLSKESEAKLMEYKVKEIKNGRLAMLAFVGFVAQHIATGKEPIDCLLQHVADPFHTTWLDNGISLPK